MKLESKTPNKCQIIHNRMNVHLLGVFCKGHSWMLFFLCRTRELVALSGAHTIGGKGFGSPVVFDNAYFKILLEKPWSSNGNQSQIDTFTRLILFELSLNCKLLAA